MRAIIQDLHRAYDVHQKPFTVCHWNVLELNLIIWRSLNIICLGTKTKQSSSLFQHIQTSSHTSSRPLIDILSTMILIYFQATEHLQYISRRMPQRGHFVLWVRHTLSLWPLGVFTAAMLHCLILKVMMTKGTGTLLCLHIRHTDLGWDTLHIVFIGTHELLLDWSQWMIYQLGMRKVCLCLEKNSKYPSTRWQS